MSGRGTAARGHLSWRRAMGGATVAAAVLLAGCSSSGTNEARPRGTAEGTIPAPLLSTTTIPGAKPPLPGAESLADVAFKTNKIGEVKRPTAMAARSGTPTLYVAEQEGRVRTVSVDIQRDKDGNETKRTYRVDPQALIDISSSVDDEGERGLLGLAFSSDGRRLYLHYSDNDGNTNIDEYRMDDDSVDFRSKRRVFFLEQPFPNHNGGQIGFGPDGFLYIGLGDGGNQGDPNGNGQNTSVLLGKILRIDPEAMTKEQAYGVPDGNPFKDGQGGAPEMWAWGLRNPWRFSWDRASRDLWVADVGGNEREEIDFLPVVQGGAGRAANLGWNLMEGTLQTGDEPPPKGYIPPIFDYDHSNGECAVVGGYVYRGKAIPSLAGIYVFADYCNGELRGLLRKADNTVDEAGFGINAPGGPLEAGGAVTTFGEDNDGELFVLAASGGIYKIVPFG